MTSHAIVVNARPDVILYGAAALRPGRGRPPAGTQSRWRTIPIAAAWVSRLVRTSGCTCSCERLPGLSPSA
jgi:hypothetical protein